MPVKANQDLHVTIFARSTFCTLKLTDSSSPGWSWFGTEFRTVGVVAGGEARRPRPHGGKLGRLDAVQLRHADGRRRRRRRRPEAVLPQHGSRRRERLLLLVQLL